MPIFDIYLILAIKLQGPVSKGKKKLMFYYL